MSPRRGRYASLITAVGKSGAPDRAEQLFEEAARTLPLSDEAWPNKYVYQAAFGATKAHFRKSLRCARRRSSRQGIAGWPAHGCVRRAGSFRWVRETKVAEKDLTKKSYGRTKMSMVSAGDTPWFPTKTKRQTYRH